MQMQLAFREATEKLGGRRVSMIAGFVSTLPGVLPSEGIAEFTFEHSPEHGLSMIGPISRTFQPERRFDPGYHSYNMGSFVTQTIWDVPRVVNVMQLYCREVRMPAANSLLGQTYAVEGLLIADPAVEPDFDHITVFQGAASKGLDRLGILGRDVNPQWAIPPMVEATRGNSLSHFFGMPVWGFGEEPVGLIASMHPIVCDALDEYRNKPESAWRPGLEGALREWGLLWPKEDQFKQTMDLIRSNHPGYLEGRSLASVETRAEAELMTARMKDALRQVLNREDSPFP